MSWWLAVCMFASLASQQSEQPLVLTMDDAVRIALQRNRTVKQAQEALAAARAAVAKARAAGRFTLALQGKLNSHEPTASFNVPLPTGQSIKVDLIPKVSWQAGVVLTQPLYRGGQLYYQRLLAELGVEASQWQQRQQQWDVIRQARELFLTVLQASEMEKVAAENVSRAAKHLQDARARVEAGAAPGFDVIRAEAEVANANDGLVAAHAAVEQALAALKTLLAIPVTRPVRLESPAHEKTELPDVAQAIQVALKNRPEVNAAETAVRLARAQVGMARTSRRPSIDLYASYQHTSVAGFAGHHWGWDVGVQLKQLVFDHGLSRAAEKEASANARKAEEVARQVQEAVALEVYQAWIDLKAAAEKIVAAEKGVRQAEEAMRIADLRYQEGVAPAVEVTDARAALIAARANLVNARFEYEKAKVKLEHAVGVPLEKLLQGGPGTGLVQPQGREASAPASSSHAGPNTPPAAPSEDDTKARAPAAAVPQELAAYVTAANQPTR